MKNKHVLKLMMAGGLALSLLMTSACAGGSKKPEEGVEPASTGTKEAEMPKKLKVFSPLSPHLATTGRSNSDNGAYQMIQEKTGTEIEWTHPATGTNYMEKLNLIIASRELPDILWLGDWKTLPGGIQKYEEDGVIVKLNELIDKHMPNYKKQLEQKPGAKKSLTMDNGDILAIASMRNEPELMVFRGPIIRQDWLDKLKLKVPETLDDLYQVFKAFKTQDPNGNGKADEWAFSGTRFADGNFGIGHMLWPFGIDWGFYQVDGSVKFGPMEPEFAEAMAFINKLYAEGLLDPDFMVQDRNKMDGKFMNDQIGYEYGIQASKMNSSMEGKNPDFKALGIPHLKGKSGKPYVFDVEYTNYIVGFNSLAITTACKVPEGAAKWVDFLFGEEGYNIANFGKLNDTYTIVDGKPKFSDKIVKNPEGLDFSGAYNKYTFGSMATMPYLQSWDAYSQSLHRYGAQSISVWAKSADTSRILPSLNFTAEEQEKINDKLNDINTYITEQFDKITIGQTPVSDIPNIQKKLKDMGIDNIISVYNEALKRYNSKK